MLKEDLDSWVTEKTLRGMKMLLEEGVGEAEIVVEMECE